MTDTKLCEIEYLAIELSALDEMDAKAVVIEADRIRRGNIAEPVPLKMRICATCRYWIFMPHPDGSFTRCCANPCALRWREKTQKIDGCIEWERRPA